MAQVTTQQNKLPSVKDFFEKPAVKQKIQELLNKNAAAFSTSVLQIVNSNALLKDAEPMTIFNAACMAATLNLPLQNGLGFDFSSTQYDELEQIENERNGNVQS